MQFRPRMMSSIAAILAIAGATFTPSNDKRVRRNAEPTKADRESKRSGRPYAQKAPHTTLDFARIERAAAKRARKAESRQ